MRTPHRGGAISARTDRLRCATLSGEARQRLEPHRMTVFCNYGAAPSGGCADHRCAFWAGGPESGDGRGTAARGLSAVVELQTVKALNFQRYVPVKQFRNSRHLRILRKASAVCSSV